MAYRLLVAAWQQASPSTCLAVAVWQLVRYQPAATWRQLACRTGTSWHVEVAKRRAVLSELVASDANWQVLTTKWDLQPC